MNVTTGKKRGQMEFRKGTHRLNPGRKEREGEPSPTALHKEHYEKAERKDDCWSTEKKT